MTETGESCVKGRGFPGSYLDGQLVKKSTAALNQVREKPNVMIFIRNCVEISCLPTYYWTELRTCMVRTHSGTSCSNTRKTGFKCFGVFTVNRIWTCAVFTRAIWNCSNQIQPRSSLYFQGICKNCFKLSMCLSVQKRSLGIKTAEEDFGSNVWLPQWLMLFSFGCLILLQTAKCAQLYSGIGSLLVEIIL